MSARLLPQLAASLPGGVKLAVVLDRTPTIRGSLREVESTLVISLGLVILVVFVFLRNVRATLIPGVAVPVSLVGTFGVMYLCGYSLDNLSLMALTIATGFVVDDAIVVLENITRHIEQGAVAAARRRCSGRGRSRFTVLSMSISLVAVFIPILLMGGIVGRLFREFAVTLSTAIAGLAPGLAHHDADDVRPAPASRNRGRSHGRFYRASERAVRLDAARATNGACRWALRHPRIHAGC